MTKNVPVTTEENIKKLLESGITIRESGDYENGEKDLNEAFQTALVEGNQKLITEAGNQLSIQYRLAAARLGRNGDIEKAKEYSLKAIKLYEKLMEMQLLDRKDAGVLRNLSHALLYAGFTTDAVAALKDSSERQTNSAAKGDELCHLGAALLELGQIREAKDNIFKGLDLITINNGAPIWLTFGLMAKATVLEVEGNKVEATKTLENAESIAVEKSLKVRLEELSYMKTNNTIDVLTTVSGGLNKSRIGLLYS